MEDQFSKHKRHPKGGFQQSRAFSSLRQETAKMMSFEKMSIKAHKRNRGLLELISQKDFFLNNSKETAEYLST